MNRLIGDIMLKIIGELAQDVAKQGVGETVEEYIFESIYTV